MITEFLTQNPNIIINTDIDGFLSGIILQKYCGAKIVGFSNSKKNIWVTPEINSIYEPIYIDLYVANPHVVCIEQHIIAHNKEHLFQIEGYGTKINPNNERGRTFVGDYKGDYFHKYPFGTVHFIIALLAREGIEVSLPSLHEEVTLPHTHVTTCLGQVLMRADDALYSSLSAYADNAIDWWEYLSSTSNCKSITEMIQFIKSCDKAQAQSYKNSIGKFFKSLGCDGLDGAFNNITEVNGSLQKRVQDFYECVKILMKEPLLPNLPEFLILHEGRFMKNSMKRESDISILSNPSLFSYAYIYGPYSPYPNFSYTLDMKD